MKIKYCQKLLDRGLSKKDIIPLLKTRSSRNPNYWIERGYDSDEAKKMANSRCPGTIEYYTLFKNKPLEEAFILVSNYQKNKANTKVNFIKKYGEKIGIDKWNSYCQKHRLKNKFEYKSKKFGWSLEEFNSYNKKRAVTLENLILRHGEIKGREMWKLYLEKQKYTKSQKYVIENYGIEEWNRLCKTKSHTYESYLERYNGNIELATENYNKYYKSISSNIGTSKIADDLFSNLVNYLLTTDYKQYYCNIHNQEWFINITDYGCVFLDFFLRDNGKVIEFYGDYWHANPKKYSSDSLVNLRSSGIKKAEEVWESDRIRIEMIKKLPYVRDIKIVWESDYRNDPIKITNECINFLII